MSGVRVDFRGNQKRVSLQDARRQQATMRAVLDRLRIQPGIILSDEVGMGKTYVALGAVAEYLVRYPRSRVLILTPSADLAEKWQQDLGRFRRENVVDRVGRRMTMTPELYSWGLGDILSSRVKSRIWVMPMGVLLSSRRGGERRRLRVLLYHLVSRAARLDRSSRKVLWRKLGLRGYTPRVRRRLWWMEKRVPSLGKTFRRRLQALELWPFDPSTVSHHALHRLIDETRWLLVGGRLRKFSLVVVDEAHHLRNPDSKNYIGLERLFAGRFRDMLFLTATPFQLGPDELQSILSLFRHSRERGSKSIGQEAQRLTLCARKYQDLVRQFEDAWRQMPSLERDHVCKRGMAGLAVNAAFQQAFKELAEGHAELETVLGKWVIRNVKDRPYRRTHEGPIEIGENERLPFAILHRLLYEYQRVSPTFSAVQNLSLTSSWEAFNESKVMTRRLARAKPVSFYRNIMRSLLSRNGDQHPKVRNLVQTVREELDRDEKILIFTSRLETVRTLQERLNQILEDDVYGALRPLPREEVDRRLRQLRKRATTARDHLWLTFQENYFTYLPRIPSVDEIYDDALRQLSRFGAGCRIGLKGKAKGPDWQNIWWLCECLFFRRYAGRSSFNTPSALNRYWKGCDAPAVWLNKKAPRKLDAAEEQRILRSHYCTREQLRKWLQHALSHECVWTPYRDVLDRFISDLELREDLLSAIGRALFVPEVIGRAALKVGARKRGVAEQEVLRAATATAVQSRVRRFLHEMQSLPPDEVRQYARGLRTENLVARASGDESASDRRRYRYGFNTPFRPYVLVASEVMQEGLDLHRECAKIVHYDLAWNPARLEQRVGRVDRLGSKVDRLLNNGTAAHLEIHRRYLPGTIDERMFRRVRDRERWFKFILGHHPEWEGDGPEEASSQPLPEVFGKRLRIALSPTDRAGAPSR